MDLDVQKKVFSRWVASFVPGVSETHFYERIQDTRTLMKLLSAITNYNFPPLGVCTSKRDAFLWLLEILKDHFCMFLDDFSVDYIIRQDFNKSEIHNFLWKIITQLFVTKHTGHLKECLLFDNSELALLQWCRNSTFGYKGVDVTNFSSSWRSGLAFNAILHKHNPRWFEYSSLIGKTHRYNLDHAFNMAEEKLAVSKLLDSRDLDVEQPDHRSIILYLVTCISKLHKSSVLLPFENVKKHDKVTPPNSPVVPLGTTKNFHEFLFVSQEILNSLKNDLNVLIESDDVSNELEVLRLQFHRHENFMLRLTKRQDEIGQILISGQDLLRCGSLDEEQKKQVERRMEMMNQSWEGLRTRAMEKQNILHSFLTSEQQQELDRFSSNLSSFENKLMQIKISSMENRPKEIEILENYLIPLQSEVMNLQTMLIVVDEAGSHSAMETQLENLGKRWLEASSTFEKLRSHNRKFLNERKAFDEKMEEFKEWLGETEALLNGVLRLESGSGGRLSEEDLENIVQQVRCMKMIENNMEDMMVQFQRLNQLGASLAATSHDDESLISFINFQLLSCQERWDEVVKKMETLSKDLSDSGIEISVVSSVPGRFDEDSSRSNGSMKGKSGEDERPFDEPSMTSSKKERNVFQSFRGFEKAGDAGSEDEILKKIKERNVSSRNRRRKFSDGGVRSASASRVDAGEERRHSASIGSDIVQLINISKKGREIARFSMSKKRSLLNPYDDGISKRSSSSSQVSSLPYTSYRDRPVLEEVAKNLSDSLKLKQDFDRQVAALSQWLDQAEVTQEMVSIENRDFSNHQPEQVNLSINEQTVLIEDAKKDLAIQRENLKTLQFTGKLLYQELAKAKRSTESLVESMKWIEKRWDQLERKIKLNEKQLNSTRAVNKFLEQLQSVEDAVSGYEKWTDDQATVSSDGDFSHLSRLLEQNRVKMKALQSHEAKFKKLKESFLDSGELDRFRKKLDSLEGRLSCTLVKMSRRQNSISQALNFTPSKSFSESLLSFLTWMERLENEVSSSPSVIIISFIEDMKKNLTFYQGLLQQMQGKWNSLEYLNHAVEELTGRLGDVQLRHHNQLSRDVTELNNRWIGLRDLINSKVERLETAIEKVSDFQVHCKELNKWLSEMEVFLNAEPPAKGNLDLLKAQFDESEGVLDDIRTMESSISSMNEVVENFCSSATPEFSRKLRIDQDEMNSRWQLICKLSERQHENLKSDLLKIEKIFSKMSLVEKWMDGPNIANMDKVQEIKTPAELASLVEHFKILLKEYEEQRSGPMSEVEKALKEVGGGEGEEMEKEEEEEEEEEEKEGEGRTFHDFKATRQRFISVGTRVKECLERFSKAHDNYHRLRELLRKENDYTENLRFQLMKYENTKTLDSEELSEELEQFESILASKNDENLSEIMKISEEFLSSKMLTRETNEMLGRLSDHKKVRAEANAAVIELSDLVGQDQERENLLSDVSHWLRDTNEVIREEMGLGRTIDKNMRYEFESRKKTLSKLIEGAQKMKDARRVKASARLEEQLQLLLKHYNEVEENFFKCQRPVGFDENLIRVTQELETLGTQLKLKLGNLTEKNINDAITTRMEVYQLMSGLKIEVENVIKNGRQVVDKKLTQHPQLLNNRLDDLKNLYNSLGVQVTTDKKDLEEFQRIFKENWVEIECIESLKKEVEDYHYQDLDCGRHWMENKNRDLHKVSESISSLEAAINHSSRLIEEECLVREKDKLERSRESLDSMTQNLLKLEQAISKDEETVEKKYQVFIDTQQNLMNELNKAEMEFKLSKTMNTFLNSKEDTLKLLERCRALTKEINSKTSKFNESIDLKVKEVNKRWKDVISMTNENVTNGSSLLKTEGIREADAKTKTETEIETENQEFPELDEMPDFHSVCEELEEINSWMNKLEFIMEKSAGSTETATAYLKNDFDLRVDKLNHLEMGFTRQKIPNKELEKKLLEHFQLLKMRMKFIERELFMDRINQRDGDDDDDDVPELDRLSFTSDHLTEYLTNLEALRKCAASLKKKMSTKAHHEHDEGQLFTALPTETISDDARLAGIKLKAASRKFEEIFPLVDNPSATATTAKETILKIKDCLDSLKFTSTRSRIDICDIHREAQGWLEVAQACLNDPLDVFVKADLLRAHSESNNVLRSCGALKRNWQRLSADLLVSDSDSWPPGERNIKECNDMTDQLNKIFIKVCRRKLKLEKYLNDVEHNANELSNLMAATAEAQALLNNSSNNDFLHVHNESDTTRLLEEILNRGQPSFNFLRDLLARSEEERDVIKMAPSTDGHDVDTKMSQWVAITNQVKALEGLNRVLNDDSIGEESVTPGLKNLSLEEEDDDVSIGETSFESFVASLSAGSPWRREGQDEALRELCSSVRGVLEGARARIVLLDGASIEAATLDLKARMKDFELKLSDARASLKDSEYSLESQELEEKLKYCKSECDSMALRRNLDLEDFLLESDLLTSSFAELKEKMDDLEKKILADSPPVDSSGDGSGIWMRSIRSMDKEKKAVFEKLKSLTSRAEGMEKQFPEEDFSLLHLNVQSVLDRWSVIESRSRRRRRISASDEARMTTTTTTMNQISVTSRKSSTQEMNAWMDGLKKELKNIETNIPEDPNALKSQLENLEALKLKVVRKENDIKNQPRLSRRMSKEINDDNDQAHTSDLEQEMKLFKSSIDLSTNDKLNLLEKATRYQDVTTNAERTLKRLNSIVSLWKPPLHPTKNQLDSELSSIKAVQSELASVKGQLEETACDQQLEKLMAPKQATSEAFKDIKHRVEILEKSVEEKLKRANQKMEEICPFSESQLSKTVSYPWERTQTDGEHPLPYYINHSLEKTQWNHPEVASLLDDMEKLSDIKFSAYRMAMKMRMIQKKLSMDKVTLEQLESFFKDESSPKLGHADAFLSALECCHLLSNLFEQTELHKHLQQQQQQQQTAVSIRRQSSEIRETSLWIELTLNFILHFFDSSRVGRIGVPCFKAFLVLLSIGGLDKKYEVLYSVMTSLENVMTSKDLKSLINICLQFPKHLGEVVAFSEDSIDLTASSCLEKSNSLDEVSLSNFVGWMKLEPQSLVWIAVNGRLCVAEKAVHHRRCNVCRQNPIIGFRYRCLKCFNFDLCQNCFFHGMSGGKGHKLSHPMQEYHSTMSSAENMRYFTQMVRNKLRSKRYFRTHQRLGYLPVTDVTKAPATRDTATRYNTLERCQPSKKSEFLESQGGGSAGRAGADAEDLPPLARSLSTGALDRGSSCSDEMEGELKEGSTEDSKRRHASLNKCRQERTLNKAAQLTFSSCTSRLAEVENVKEFGAPDWSDEHNLIAQYCKSLRDKKPVVCLQSPMEILIGVESDYKNELEISIREVEEETRLLQKEYNELKRAQTKVQQLSSSGQAVFGKSEFRMKSRNQDDSMATSRNDKNEKLDKRTKSVAQQINKLEAQLKQLKKMLDEKTAIGPILSHDLGLLDCSAPSLNSLTSSCNPPSFQQAKSQSKASGKRNSSKERQTKKGHKEDSKSKQVTSKQLQQKRS